MQRICITMFTNIHVFRMNNSFYSLNILIVQSVYIKECLRSVNLPTKKATIFEHGSLYNRIFFFRFAFNKIKTEIKTQHVYRFPINILSNHQQNTKNNSHIAFVYTNAIKHEMRKRFIFHFIKCNLFVLAKAKLKVCLCTDQRLH